MPPLFPSVLRHKAAEWSRLIGYACKCRHEVVLRKNNDVGDVAVSVGPPFTMNMLSNTSPPFLFISG